MLPRIRDHGDCFLVLLRQNADHVGSSTWAEFHPFPDSKIKHGAVRAHLAEKAESSYNLVVKFDQIFFGERIHIEVSHCRFFPR